MLGANVGSENLGGNTSPNKGNPTGGNTSPKQGNPTGDNTSTIQGNTTCCNTKSSLYMATNPILLP